MELQDLIGKVVSGIWGRGAMGFNPNDDELNVCFSDGSSLRVTAGWHDGDPFQHAQAIPAGDVAVPPPPAPHWLLYFEDTDDRTKIPLGVFTTLEAGKAAADKNIDFTIYKSEHATEWVKEGDGQNASWSRKLPGNYEYIALQPIPLGSFDRPSTNDFVLLLPVD